MGIELLVAFVVVGLALWLIRATAFIRWAARSGFPCEKVIDEKK